MTCFLLLVVALLCSVPISNASPKRYLVVTKDNSYPVEEVEWRRRKSTVSTEAFGLSPDRGDREVVKDYGELATGQDYGIFTTVLGLLVPLFLPVVEKVVDQIG